MSDRYVNCDCSEEPWTKYTTHHPNCPNHPSHSEYASELARERLEADKQRALALLSLPDVEAMDPYDMLP